MTDQSLFNQESTEAHQPQSEQQAPQTDVFGNLLTQIKNEKGEQKYGNVEEALKGAANAQEYIQRMRQEQEELKRKLEELEGKATMEQNFQQQLAELKALQERGVKGESTTVHGKPQSQEETIASVVQKLLAENQSREQQAKQAEQAALNEKAVSDALANRYGSKAGEVLKSKAQELGVSLTDLQQQARTNPKLVLGLFGQTAPATKSVNTSSYNLSTKQQPEVIKPEKSLLRGATTKDVSAYVAALREKAHRKYEID